MTDNMFIHAVYTSVVVIVDHVSALAAVFLFICQAIILAPKAYRQLRKWLG